MRFYGTMFCRPFAWMGRRLIAEAWRPGPRYVKPITIPAPPLPVETRYYDGVPARTDSPKATMGHSVAVAARERVKRTVQPCEVFRSGGQPAAVKSNGGLRGSKATRWR